MLSFAWQRVWRLYQATETNIENYFRTYILSLVCVTRGFLQPSKNLSSCSACVYFFNFFFFFVFLVFFQSRSGKQLPRNKNHTDTKGTFETECPVIIFDERNRIQFCNFVCKNRRYIYQVVSKVSFALQVNTVIHSVLRFTLY